MKIHITSASAGSGKTHHLAEQAYKAIAEEGVRPGAIMAITYTNKAAAELRHRLGKRLLEDGRADAAARLRDGYIGTVHSISQRIVTELAFETGQSPYPIVIPSGYAGYLFKTASNAAVDAVADAEWDAAIRHLGLLPDDSRERSRWDAKSWRELLGSMVSSARENRMRGDALAVMAERGLEEVFAVLPEATGEAGERDRTIQEAIENARERFEGQYVAAEKRGKTPARTVRNRRAWARAMVRLFERGDSPPWHKLKLNLTSKDEAALPELVDALATHLTHPRFHAEYRTAIEGLYAATSSTLSRFNDLKRAERLVDYGDMLAEAARVLSLDVGRQALDGRIDLLMVDEFQDTSPIQLQIIMALAGLAGRTVWVGDRKQAIFGFQGSDPELMEEVAAQVQQAVQHADQQAERLHKSYRSRPKLVSFCSGVFALGLEPHGFQRDEVRLTSACAVPPEVEQQPAVQLWKQVPGGEDNKKKTAAHATAKAIAGLLSEGKLMVREPGGDPTVMSKARPARAGDIAVLARTNVQCRTIANALRGHGVQASTGGGGLGETPEAWILRAGMALLADPGDALAAAELSLLCGEVGDPDAWLQARIDVVAAEDAARRVAREEGDEQPKRSPAFEDSAVVQAVRSLSTRAAGLDPEEAMTALVTALDLDRIVTGWPEPARRRANLEALLGVARAYRETCLARRRACTVAGLVHHLETLDDDEPQSPGEVGGAVRVLTYHKSKGLEWPVVVCTALEKGSKDRVFGVRVEQVESLDIKDPLAGRELRVVPWPYAAKSTGFELPGRVADSEFGQRVQSRGRAEAARLLYVGFTRARDHLILTALFGKAEWIDELVDKEKRPVLGRLDWSAPGVQELQGIDRKHEVLVADPVRCDPPPGEDVVEARSWFSAVDTRTGRPPQLLRPSDAKLTEEAAAAFKVIERIQLGPPANVAIAADRMSALGDAVHAFLAADVNGTLLDDTREGVAQALLDRHGFAGEASAGLVVGLSDRLRRWLGGHAAGGARLPEWPIQWRREDGRVLSGDIDLLVQDDDGWLIIDHKTTRIGEGHLEDALRGYAGQLAAYRDAVVAATGQEVTKLWVHMPVRGELVQVSIPAEIV